METAGRIDLNADHEAGGGEPLGERRGGQLLRRVEVDGDRGRAGRLANSGRASEWLEGGAHGRDVRGGGAAAAPNVGHPEIGRLAGGSREVLRGGDVEEPPLDAGWESGVGRARQRPPGLLAHRLEHLQRDLGTDPAVDADDVDARTLERLDHLARFLRAEGETVFGA